MTTLFSDAFTRANSSTIGNNWVENIGDWEIISNAVREPTLGGVAGYLLNTTTLGTANYSIQVDITQGALVSGTNRGIGIVARLADLNNFYLAWINELGSPIQLYSVSGGSFNVVGSWTPSPNPLPDPVSLRLECQGSTIRVFVNGTQRISVTDTANTTEGDFGLRVYFGSSFSDHRFDNVVVADFATAGTTITPGTIVSGAALYPPQVIGPCAAQDSYTTLESYTYANLEAFDYENLETSLCQAVTPNAIATAAQVYAPTVTLQVLPGTIGTAEQVYAPTVRVQVLPGTIATAAVVFAPSLTMAAAGQVNPDAIPSAAQVFAPTVFAQISQTVRPDTISTAAVAHTPSILYVIRPDGIVSMATVYAPSVAIVPRAPAPPLEPCPEPSFAPELVACLAAPAPSLWACTVPLVTPVLVASSSPSAPALVGAVTAEAPPLLLVR